MEPFDQRFNRTKRDELRDCLTHPGVTLTDYEIQNLFYVMARERAVDPQAVRFAEPTLTELIMEDGGGDPSDPLYVNHVDSLRRDVRDGAIVLIPLCDAMHWSLLVLRVHDRHWFHFDSLYGYHWDYAKRVLRRFVTLGLCLAADEMTRLDALPRQSAGWECGLYVLFYALVVALSPAASQQHWRRECSYMCEASRGYFTETLLSWLDKE